MFLDGSRIRVVAQRFDEKVYVATSTNGGSSFDGPLNAVGEPPLIAPLEDAVAGPGGDLYLLYAGLVQKTSFDAIAAETAFAEVGELGFDYGQSVALWDSGQMVASSNLHEVAVRYSIGAAWGSSFAIDQGGFEGLRMSCRGGGRCHGAVKPIGGVRVRRSVPPKSRRQRAMRRSRPVLISKAQFDIPAGKAKCSPSGSTARGGGCCTAHHSTA